MTELLLTRYIREPNCHTLAFYEKTGGYQALKKAIGMAYLPIEHTASGTEFEVDIRGRRSRARVVPMPFYKRVKAA